MKVPHNFLLSSLYTNRRDFMLTHAESDYSRSIPKQTTMCTDIKMPFIFEKACIE